MTTKSFVLRLSDEVQQQVKELIQKQPEPDHSTKRSFKKLNAVWAELLRLGFTESDCETVLALHHVHDLTSALDWLTVHLPNDQLPRQVSNNTHN